MIKTRQRINELSKDLVNRAADRQEKLLKSSGYLHKISAYQYLKCIQRLEDFRKYADAMVDAINTGNIGTPMDPEVPVKEADKTANEISKKSNDPIKKTPRSYGTISIEERIDELDGIEPFDTDVPVIKPRFPFAGRVRPGKYIIKYISKVDDDVCTVWLESKAINAATSRLCNVLWDVKEIKDVCFEDDKPAEQSPVEPVIDKSQFDNLDELGDMVAKVMSDGNFVKMKDIIIDKYNDKTTIDCAKGSEYYSEYPKNPWRGKKSSYLFVQESYPEEYTSPEDRPITIVTHINKDDVDDVKFTGKFNLAALRKALHGGVVHFQYTKKDGTERQAYGSLNYDILLENNMIKNPEVISTQEHILDYETYLRYYDMTYNGWRTAIVENINIIYDEYHEELIKMRDKKIKRMANKKKK